MIKWSRAKLNADPISFRIHDFSRRELQTLIPGSTKWRIDQARQHATEAGKLQVGPNKQSSKKGLIKETLVIS